MNKLSFESAMQVLAPELAGFQVGEDFDFERWATALAIDVISCANGKNISPGVFAECKEGLQMHMSVMQDKLIQHLEGKPSQKDAIDLRCTEQCVPNDQECESRVTEIDLLEDEPKFKRASSTEGRFFRGGRGKQTATIQVGNARPRSGHAAREEEAKRHKSDASEEPLEAWEPPKEPSEEF